MTERSAVADTRRLIAIGVAVSVSYVLAAKLGFRVAFVAEQVTTVWAPTGIGMAALLLWGRALWPAIWLGAFVANAGTDAPLWTAAAVATGNTLEAVSRPVDAAPCPPLRPDAPAHPRRRGVHC